MAIYLDYAATTPMLPAAAEVMADICANVWGNPSSVHSAGLAARAAVERARELVLALLGAGRGDTGMLVFTGSGTEASNLAIFGVARSKRWKSRSAILTTDSEHPSVEEPLRALEREGYIVERIPTKGGVLDFEALDEAIFKHKNIVLASFMLVNNETGAVYDVAKAFSMIKRVQPDAVTHCDAVQGFGKLSFTPSVLGADLVTVSAHKLGGPKGAGALYISKPVIVAKKIVPLVYGGGQENGYRSGTENVAAIAGFGAAAEFHLSAGTRERFCKATKPLLELLEQNLPEGARLNTPLGEHMPHIASITVPGIKSEVMLRYLSGRGIYVSSGSACSSRHRGISRTLLAFGLSENEADCTIRVSFSDATGKDEILEFAAALRDGMASIAKIR